MMDKNGNKTEQKQPEILQKKDKLKPTEYIPSIQLLCGVSGLIFTIVDANRKLDEIKIYNSNGYVIDTKDVKNKWAPIHTALTIVSCSLILSGSITIFF